MGVSIFLGDCRDILPTLPDKSVHCCVTSPPYFGLRDYGVDGQIGLEPTTEAYVKEIVAVFREVRRVMRDDGTLWLNLGDSYSAKQLLGMPWRVAFALQADGWWLRSDIIWAKINPLPESVTDRPTKSHEYIFLLSKSERYYFDQESVKEEGSLRPSGQSNHKYVGDDPLHRTKYRLLKTRGRIYEKRNIRSVWTIPYSPFTGSHFAPFPPELAARCINAGCPQGGTVLDPFGGSGTTGLVADRLSRDAVLIEISQEYAAMARQRITADAPLLAELA